MAAAPFDRIAFARRILETETAALANVAERLGEGFDRVAEKLFHCRGRIAVAGVGKSADVGQKIVGTLNSTGTRAYATRPDAGRAWRPGAVHPDDVALLLRTAASRMNSSVCLARSANSPAVFAP